MSDIRFDDLPELCTVEEYALFTRQGKTKAYEDVRIGRVESIRLGRTIRIPRRALEELMGAQRSETDLLRCVK